MASSDAPRPEAAHARCEAEAPLPCQGCHEGWPLMFVKGSTLEGTMHLVPRPLVALGAYDRLYRCTSTGEPHADTRVC